MSLRAGARQRTVGRIASAAVALQAWAVSSQGVPVPPTLPVIKLEGATTGSAAPSTEPAPNPSAQLPPLAVTELDQRERSGLDARTLSLTVSQPLPIRDVLLLLVRGTPFSVVVDAGVTGTFAGELRELRMRQALETVLFPSGLDYEVKGNVIRVFPRRAETRLFEVNALNLRRRWHRVLGAVPIAQLPVSSISASLESDPFAELDTGVQAMLSSSGRYHIDRKAGLLQVTDFADRLDQISVYLEAVQLRASRQIRLQARLFEVALTGERSGGLDWAALAARPNSGVRSGMAGAGTAGIIVDNFDALMRTIAAEGTVSMIAAPQVLAMNNEPAVMRVDVAGASLPNPDTTNHTGGDRVPAPGAGLTLGIIPQIGADGMVQLSVTPSYARASEQRADDPSVLRITDLDTVVRVRDGETVIISGLIQGSTLAASSGTGSAQDSGNGRSELVMLFTPTVVRPAAPPPGGAR